MRNFSNTQRYIFDALVAVFVVVSVFVGWRIFWFLTDDAYIAFRYTSNSMKGLGFVWNPPPFKPVEGYTSFLWVVLLTAIWRWTSLMPPVTANWLSLAFGYGTVVLMVLFVRRMALPSGSRYSRRVLLLIVFVGVVTNRTWLAWLSSGLETSMFNFFFLAWMFFTFEYISRRSRLALTALCLAGSLCALTRPDGLLAYAATLGLLSLLYLDSGEFGGFRWPTLLSLAPLAIVPAHFLWRYQTYGEWLPNTYYAKNIEPWPESGARYIMSFVIEYSLWIWLAVFFVWLVKNSKSVTEVFRVPFLRRRLALLIIVPVILFHICYYTFNIGGDHFEFRIYSYLIPLIFLTFVWLCAQTFSKPYSVYALAALFIVLSWPIPWTHWWQTKDNYERAETFRFIEPIASHFPPGARWLVNEWDEMQAWLIWRGVCARHQEHKVFWKDRLALWPTRDEGSKFKWEEKKPIIALYPVGVASWTLPEVAVIDKLGLNDHVVARQPVDPNQEQYMAHNRRPPEGYVECFRPNVERITKNRDGRTIVTIRVKERNPPLTDEDIRECERKYAP